jgi:hypothetical protein
VPIDATRRQRSELRGSLQLRDPEDDPVEPDAFPTPEVAAPAMNNKVKMIAHRAYGFRKAETSIIAIYHCCAACRYREHFPETNRIFKWFQPHTGYFAHPCYAARRYSWWRPLRGHADVHHPPGAERGRSTGQHD